MDIFGGGRALFYLPHGDATLGRVARKGFSKGRHSSQDMKDKMEPTCEEPEELFRQREWYVQRPWGREECGISQSKG